MTMRHTSTVTSVAWIPSEAISGMLRLPMDTGIGHYDDPLPDHIEDLEALRVADRFRFANELSAWIEVEDDRIVDAGYSGKGHIGATTLRFGVGEVTIPAVAFPARGCPPTKGTVAGRVAAARQIAPLVLPTSVRMLPSPNPAGARSSSRIAPTGAQRNTTSAAPASARPPVRSTAPRVRAWAAAAGSGS